MKKKQEKALSLFHDFQVSEKQIHDEGKLDTVEYPDAKWWPKTQEWMKLPRQKTEERRENNHNGANIHGKRSCGRYSWETSHI